MKGKNVYLILETNEDGDVLGVVSVHDHIEDVRAIINKHNARYGESESFRTKFRLLRKIIK